jgi:hypothetical protein
MWRLFTAESRPLVATEETLLVTGWTLARSLETGTAPLLPVVRRSLLIPSFMMPVFHALFPNCTQSRVIIISYRKLGFLGVIEVLGRLLHNASNFGFFFFWGSEEARRCLGL